jgi:uncharacterized protein
MCDSLRARHPDQLNDIDIAELRLAGLLHDIGHGPFSHLSEAVFSSHYSGELDAIRSARPEFAKKGLGEILSHTIVTSEPFRRHVRSLQTAYDMPEIDLDRIAGYFVGHSDDPFGQFKADIISGAFDADKLDYFARDCFFSGIRAEIDVDRMLLIIDIDIRPTSSKHQLVIDRSGVHHMEHVIFSKMQLFSSVYHHHTIRALECGVKSMFDRIWADPSDIADVTLRFPYIWSLLTMGEDEFWVRSSSEKRLAGHAHALWSGRVPMKRALALGMSTVEPQSRDAAFKLWSMEPFPAQHRTVATAIQGMAQGISSEPLFGVWWDMPSSPGVSGDATKTMVKTGEEYVPLDHFFPAADWVSAYGNHNLMAHVYSDDNDSRPSVTSAAIQYFSDAYGIQLKPLARDQCYKTA